MNYECTYAPSNKNNYKLNKYHDMESIKQHDIKDILIP